MRTLTLIITLSILLQGCSTESKLINYAKKIGYKTFPEPEAKVTFLYGQEVFHSFSALRKRCENIDVNSGADIFAKVSYEIPFSDVEINGMPNKIRSKGIYLRISSAAFHFNDGTTKIRAEPNFHDGGKYYPSEFRSEHLYGINGLVGNLAFFKAGESDLSIEFKYYYAFYRSASFQKDKVKKKLIE